MARKYDLISELYNRTCKTVVSNPQNWQAFLASACRNYKLRYDEQLLVYAQRPDATAVLEIEQWNKIFGRWVNRGARGIAVFADENRSRQRLTHYFDISDTHESRYSRTVPIWDMRQEYEADVIETLESTFGEIENKSSLAEAIMGAARNAAEDNIPDYLQDLYYATEGSSFEEVEEDIVAFIYKNVVTNSVAYMMMSRLGVDTDGYFELDDFRDVTNFNTQETLNALGFATSDIAEMGLTEISKTITALNRQNRIIVGQDRNEYNKVENNDERSLDNERTDLHDGGDYSLPNLKLPQQPEVTLGRYAQMRRDFLKEHHRVLYYNLLTRGELTQHLAEVEQRASKMEETILSQMAQKEGVSEQMKAEDMMKWVRLMNSLRSSAQEIVKAEVIFA
mgnify:FL=1